jgi:quinohemoprotein ethanol dehydrogenase
VLTFAIGGKDKLSAASHQRVPIADDAAFSVDLAKVKQGQAIFADRCAICHGANALSGGAGPDLLRSTIPLDAAAFGSVLAEGALVPRGMPAFKDLSPAEDEALRHYIRQRAREESAATAAKLNRSQDAGQ